MCRQGRSTARNEPHCIEVAQRPDGRKQRANEIKSRYQRHSHVDEFLCLRGSIDIRRFIELARNGEPTGEEDESPKWQPFPNMSVDDGAKGKVGAVKPGWAVDL